MNRENPLVPNAQQSVQQMPMQVVQPQQGMPIAYAAQVPVAYAPAAQAPHMDNAPKDLSILDIVKILDRGKWFIAIPVLFCTLTALLYTLTIPPVYGANATIRIEKKGPEIVNYGHVDTPVETADMLQDPFFRTTYEGLRSRVLIQSVIDDLQMTPYLTKGMTEEELRLVDPVDLFKRVFSVGAVDQSRLVEVSFDAHDPELAKKVVDTVVGNFIQSKMDDSSDTSRFAIEFLEKQIAEAKQHLVGAEKALVDYSEKNGILSVDEGQRRHLDKLGQLNSALVQAEIRRSQAESTYRQAQSSGQSSMMINNGTIAELKSRLVVLESEYNEKLKIFRPNYPDMVRLQEQINTTRNKLRGEQSNINTSLRSEYMAAKAQESRIRRDLRKLNSNLSNLQNNSLDYNRLKREAITAGALYEKLLERHDEVKVRSAVSSSSITVVDPAVLPRDYYKPEPRVNVLIGFMVGFVIGLMLAFMREALDRRIRNVEDFQRVIGKSVLGQIPLGKHRYSEAQMATISVTKPSDKVAECYRILAANLRFLGNAAGGNAIMVSSVSEGQGRSVTAANLAASYAQMGLKVLLVDADLRKPSMHRLMGVSNRTGLSNYLAKDDDLIAVTQASKTINGLFVIAAGSYQDDPMRLVSSPRMKHLLDQAQQRFDYIIVDAPPVNGYAETLVLAGMLQQSILTTTDGKIDTETTLSLLQQLERLQHNVIGFVLVSINKQSKGKARKLSSSYTDAKPAPRLQQRSNRSKRLNAMRSRGDKKGNDLNLIFK